MTPRKPRKPKEWWRCSCGKYLVLGEQCHHSSAVKNKADKEEKEET